MYWAKNDFTIQWPEKLLPRRHKGFNPFEPKKYLEAPLRSTQQLCERNFVCAHWLLNWLLLFDVIWPDTAPPRSVALRQYNFIASFYDPQCTNPFVRPVIVFQVAGAEMYRRTFARCFRENRLRCSRDVDGVSRRSAPAKMKRWPEEKTARKSKMKLPSAGWKEDVIGVC